MAVFIQLQTGDIIYAIDTDLQPHDRNFLPKMDEKVQNLVKKNNLGDPVKVLFSQRGMAAGSGISAIRTLHGIKQNQPARGLGLFAI